MSKASQKPVSSDDLRRG